MDSSELLNLFVSEAREHLEGLSGLLTRAREQPPGTEEINDLFRHAHSLKGMALSLGFRPLAALAHAMEDLLHDWRSGSLRSSPEAVALLLQAADRLAAQVDAVAAGGEPPAAGELVAALRDALGSREPAAPEGPAPAPAAPPERIGPVTPASAVAGAGHPVAGAGTPVPESAAPVPGAAAFPTPPRLTIEVVLRPDAPLPAARLAVLLQRLAGQGEVLRVEPPAAELAQGRFEGRFAFLLATAVPGERIAALVAAEQDVASCRVVPQEEEKPVPEGPARPEGIASIRVATGRLDAVLDGIGELILDRERLKRSVGAAEGSPAAETLEKFGRTIDSLRDEVMQMRLLPFASILPRLQRTVRDLSARLGKNVELAARGADVALDRSILEDLVDPLEHILRNALDHGLEDAPARQAAGKPPAGRITLDLARVEDRVRLVVEDDGRGIDPDQLRRVAVERRFIGREVAARMSDEEALMLVTLPGFSTATRTTDISGRGVGMDVVRMRLQKIGGRLNIRSQPGSGTRFEMDLPPSVTVTRAFLCRSDGEVYAVPVAAVEATLELRRDALQSTRGEQVTRHASDLVTVLPLGGVLAGGRDTVWPVEFPALIYRVGRRPYALAVDAILGEQEIVVKPLRHPLELMPQYAGATVLDDGRIALILDPVNLTRTARSA